MLALPAHNKPTEIGGTLAPSLCLVTCSFGRGYVAGVACDVIIPFFVGKASSQTICAQPNPFPRRVRLFRNKHKKGIRIPIEFELPCQDASLHRDGDRLITESVNEAGLLAILANWDALNDPFPDVDQTLLPLPTYHPLTCYILDTDIVSDLTRSP